MERLATQGADGKLRYIPAVPLYAAAVRDRFIG